LSRQNSQIAYLLHARDYRETSSLLTMFTQKFGLISLIAKGARRSKSKTRSFIVPFKKLEISWAGQSDLKTLTSIEEVNGTRLGLAGLSLYCGFYLNELVIRLLPFQDAHLELFQDYDATLCRLNDQIKYEATLRLFEKHLLEYLGYGLNLQYDVLSQKPLEAEKYYRYDIESGPVLSTAINNESLYQGKTLIALANEDLQDSVIMKECKLLMRTVLNFYLGGKPLKSRELLVNHF